MTTTFKGESDMTCNGWTNAATWTVSLWFGDTFASYAEDGEALSEESCRELVEEAIYSVIEPDNGGIKSFIHDMIDLGSVNWFELAQNYGDA
jgi:hypothetical protein